MKFLCVILLFFSIITAKSQEKNFEVRSGVNCEDLKPSFETLAEALSQITQAEYRFTESFTIRRKKGLKAGNFYSCNATTGYLVLQIGENKIIYLDVPKSEWEALVKSNDPDYYIQNRVKPIYTRIE